MTRRTLLRWAATVTVCLAPWFSNADSISLSWLPTDPSDTGYNVYYGESSGNYSTEMSVSTNTTATVTGLSEGKTYYFVVTAVDSSGVESAPSGEVAVSIPILLQLRQGITPTLPVLLSFTAEPARAYEVDATTDFVSWTSILQTNVTAVDSAVQFGDGDAANYPARFYRLVIH